MFFIAGTLVVERSPARPPLTNPAAGSRIEAPPGGLPMSAQQRQNTLAQLQMQVQVSVWLAGLFLRQTKLGIQILHTQCFLFLCLRWTKFPNRPTDSLPLTTGNGIKTCGSLDPLALHHRRDLFMEVLHHPRVRRV